MEKRPVQRSYSVLIQGAEPSGVTEVKSEGDGDRRRDDWGAGGEVSLGDISVGRTGRVGTSSSESGSQNLLAGLLLIVGEFQGRHGYS